MLTPNPVPLWEIMQLIKSWNLLYATSVFSMAMVPGQRDRNTDAKERSLLHGLAQSLVEECQSLGLRSAYASATRLSDLCAAPQDVRVTAGQIADQASDWFSRMADEMSGMLIYAVPFDLVSLVQTPDLFGAKVAEVFPAAIGDIEEAGKCLAFERGTACVFHLMRVMEVGLRLLGKQLGIPYAPSWESYITQIDKRINTKHKSKGVRWKRDEPYFRDVLGDLTAIKVAWRNPTMHVRRVYARDEASDVFNAVRALMQRMAERPDPPKQTRT